MMRVLEKRVLRKTCIPSRRVEETIRRSSRICTHKYFSGGQAKKNETRIACSRIGRRHA
jgi:hypothetical protein